MDYSNKRFKELIMQSNEMIERWYSEKLRGARIYENKTPKEIKKTFNLSEKNKSCKPENVLKHLEVKFTGINVLEDSEIRGGIKVFSDWPTIPQLYIKGEFIGGCDIVKEMFEKDELQKKLKEKKIPYKSK